MQAAAPGVLRAGGCDRCAKCGREEPPHVCQGQKLVGPHARRVAAKRSYSASEVRGAAKRRYPGSEVRGGRPRGDTQRPRSGAATRGVTLHPRSGAAAGRSYPTLLSPRPGAVAGRSNRHLRLEAVAGRTNPTSKELWLCGHRRA